MKKLMITITVLLLVFLTTSIYSQNAGDFRSAASGDWSTTAIWEVFDGSLWNSAASPPTGSENITITDSVVIDAAITITGYVKVIGLLVDGSGSIAFENGSTYEHDQDGWDIPTATWGSGSTCLITGVSSSAPGNTNQDFYNFTWNCAGQSSNVDVSWSGNTIGGNLTCESTGGGSSQFRLTSSGDYTDSITINGDVILTDGNLTMTGSSSTMEYKIFVNGNITVTGGSFALSRGSGGNAIWNVSGDISVSNAQVRSSNSDAKFLFFGDVIHALTYSSVSYNGTINYALDTDDTLEIADGPDAVDLSVNGLFTNSGVVNTTGALSFLNGSTYNHAQNGGDIPTATWNSGSTCLITGIAADRPGNRAQSFYHFTWNCPGQTGNETMGWSGITIGGNVTCVSSGGSQFRLTSQGEYMDSITIMGDVIVQDGTLTSTGSSGAQEYLIIVHGDIIATGGSFGLSRNSAGVATWRLFGDLNVSNAELRSSNPDAKIAFSGLTTQNLTFTNVSFGSGGFSASVATGSTLNIGTSVIGGSGYFTVDPGATIECGHQGGLDSSFQITGVLTLSKMGNYIFNGTVAQNTGTALPDTVSNLTINNSSSVILSDDVTVSGTLSVSDGDLDLNGNTIILGSSAMLSETAGNTVMGTSGKITTTHDLNAPSGDNVVGLGAMITSSANLGSTVIDRVHSAASGGGNEGIFRQYSISPTNNSGLDATFRLYYDESELNGISQDKLTLFKSLDGTSSWVDNGGTVNTTDNYVELSGIGDFSYWTLGDVDNPVPVELISFNASVDGRAVILKWITASELNNHGWEVERRTQVDEKNFNEWRLIGFVEGSSNSAEQVSYSFKDEMSSAGLYQFRLKQLDFDGSYEYSDIVEVELSSTPTEFALFQNYPNPFNPETVIEFQIPSNSMVNIAVYNTLGEKVVTLLNEQLEQGYYTKSFDGSNLPSGIYIYRLTAGNRIFTKKMMLIK